MLAEGLSAVARDSIVAVPILGIGVTCRPQRRAERNIAFLRAYFQSKKSFTPRGIVVDFDESPAPKWPNTKEATSTLFALARLYSVATGLEVPLSAIKARYLSPYGPLPEAMKSIVPVDEIVPVWA